MKKFRFKNSSEKVLGPFELKDILKLVENKIITGEEECQEFPAGDWKPVSDVAEIAEVIESFILGENIELENKIEDTEKVKSDYKEFKFSKNSNEIIDYDSLEKKYNEKNISNDFENNNEDIEEEPNIDKTIIINKDQINIDKTIIVNREDLNELIEKPIDDESVSDNDVEETKTQSFEEIKNSQDIQSEKTEFFNLEEVKNKLKEEALLEEEVRNEKKESTETKTLINILLPEKKRNTIKPISAFAIIIILYFTLFDEKVEKKEIKRVKFLSPVSKEIANTEKAHEFYELGTRSYNEGTYFSKIKASNYFKMSLEENFSKNPSLAKLIKTYAELYPNAANKKNASVVLIRLIKIARSKILKNSDIAYGTALLYKYNKKNAAAIRTIENYLRVSKPNVNMMSLYGQLLLNEGEFNKAKDLISKMEKVSKKTPEAYEFLLRYYRFDQRQNKIKVTLKNALSNYPTNTQILLSTARYYLDEGMYNDFQKTLKYLDETQAEGEPRAYSEYLELMAVLSAIKGDVKKSAILFNSALKIYEKEGLRSKLAQLEVGGDELSENLILESKSIEAIIKSKILIKERKWEEAFNLLLNAVDDNPHYLPVELTLIDLQLERGYIEQAILRLNKLKKVFPLVEEISFRLVKAYLDGRKLEKAKEEINLLASNITEQTDRYFSLLGYYYLFIKEYALGIKFYRKSIDLNPLCDECYYEISKTYLNGKKFKNARKNLSEAISLNPENLKYRIMYSEILFEFSGADSAIGYIHTMLKDYPDDPLLLGTIAIYYYRSGQIKQFEFYKAKFSNLNIRDESFYRFMVESAKLEGRNAEVIKYSTELLKVVPGDIKVLMSKANYLADSKRYFEAINAYKSVLKRFPGFPLAHYSLGKVYLIQNKNELAVDAGKEEVKYNPTLYNGYYIIGEANRKLKNYDEAIKYLEKAISISPRSVESLISLAWIKLHQNYLEISRELYIRAKKIKPNYPEIRRDLGEVYLRIGQGTLAREEFEVYLKLAPQASDRQQIQAKIKRITR